MSIYTRKQPTLGLWLVLTSLLATVVHAGPDARNKEWNMVENNPGGTTSQQSVNPDKAAGSRMNYSPAFTLTPEIPPLRDKTLVVWCSIADLAQRGGGVLSIDVENQFDAIVFGEVRPQVWMAGSDLFHRTDTDQSGTVPETSTPEVVVQIAIVYEDTQVQVYRNGTPYSNHTITTPAIFGSLSRVLIGLRHASLAGSGTGCFAGTVEEARIYARALNQAEINSLVPGGPDGTSPLAQWTFAANSAVDLTGTFPPGELSGDAHIENGRLVLAGNNSFMMTPSGAQFDPVISYRPVTGVAGDTIPFYWEGVYHVFYLHGPHWAHLASRDLLSWEQLPNAVEKDTAPEGPDGEACWTGSVIEHEGVFHLFYTGKNINDPSGDQKVMHATSSDLTNWTQHPEHTFYADGVIYWSRPVNGDISDQLAYHHQAFRDPEVIWNAETEEWWLLLHAARADGSTPVFALYTSTDLLTWEPKEPLFTYPAAVSGDCPNLFELNGRWYLIAADFHATIADRPAGPYASEMIAFDCGELRVPKTMFDGARRILIGWVGDRSNFTDAGEFRWGGSLSLPRELYAGEQGELLQRPLEEVVAVFSEEVYRHVGEPLQEAEVSSVPRDAMVTAQISPETLGTKIEVSFRLPPEPVSTEDGYHLTIDFESGEITLGDDHRSFMRTCPIAADQPLQVRLFVVGTLIEAFVNEAYCFTMRAYDHWGSGLTIRSIGGAAGVDELTIHRIPGTVSGLQVR